LTQGGEKPNASRASNQNSPETGLPDIKSQVEFCRSAEACGIDSLLVAFGYYMPDPILLSAALGLATERIKLMIAYRSGVASPVQFVQQLNTLSALICGRV
jgi:alkanesulfonate monooxygenase